MPSQFGRTSRIFRLAVGLFGDYRRIRRIQKRSARTDQADQLADAYARAGARVCRSAMQLQGLIVKVGQFLSARSDVLPVAFTRELSVLQDAVPPAPFASVERLMTAELGRPLGEVFPEFNRDPIAAASLGQVYRASLPDGTPVAVKVLRPGIERLARVDLAALRKVARVVERWTRFGRRMNVWQLYREFATTVQEELDYHKEAANLQRFATDMAGDDRIVVPAVYADVSTARVLVMGFIDGAKVTDVDRIAAWDVSPQRMVNILLDSYLRQVLETGLIHVDPHPGNLLVLPDGRLCFLDFGMMSDLPRSDARLFARLVQGLMVRDLDGAVQAIDDLGFLQPHADRTFLKRAVGFMLDRLNGVELQRGPELDKFMDEFYAFLHDEPIQIPAKYMFLGRALGMVIGLMTTLSPDIEWGAVLKDRALPFIQRLNSAAGQGPAWLRPFVDLASEWLGAGAGTGIQLAVDEMSKLARLSLRLPGRLDRTLEQLERGTLQVRLDLDAVMRRVDRQQRLFARALWLAFSAGTAVAGLWCRHNGFVWVADGCFVLAGLGLVAWLASFRRRIDAGVQRGHPHRRGRS